ncbi:mitochondrial transcription termination factor [Anticarsia gemmatalis]|uniref:mitochondrial transcription termination factor n=1 Tax=Anticarsia gemmatalis TaxID=129554 RepID=UPI003F760337
MALRSVIVNIFLRPNVHSMLKLISIGDFSLPTQCHHITCSYKIPIVTYKTKTTSSKDAGFDESKARVISALNFQSAEDALPYYKLPIKTLVHIYKTTKNDEWNGFCKNRLYYIASRIKVPPSELREKLPKRTFVYSLSFEWIERALDTLLDLGVPGDRILRDLWVLKYHHETIRERLQTVKDMGIENLYPWMVRCSESILKRFISLSQETKDILGETKSTQIYLANRLNTSVEAIEDMCLRMPALKTIRVTKVKPFLDFLIAEGFRVEDIANKPRVLSASQKTVKDRLEKLRGLGIHQINLNVLCRSKKGFKRYCDSIESMSEDIRMGHKHNTLHES